MKNILVIHIKGGSVNEAFANTPIELIVLDSDIGDTDSPRIEDLGRVAFDYPEVTIDPRKVALVKCALKSNEEKFESEGQKPEDSNEQGNSHERAH